MSPRAGVGAALVVALAITAVAPTWADELPVPPAPAEGEPAPAAGDARLTAIYAEIEAARFGEAYRLALEAVAATPADADVRYYATLAAMRVARFDEADAHVAAGLGVRAGDADLLGLRSQLQLMRGDEDAARASAAQALAIDPEAADALATRDEIALTDRARARLGGEDPGLVAGSAAAFVDAFVAQIAAGASPATLARAFDVSFLDALPASERTEAALARTMSGALRQARNARAAADQHILGWVTSPEATAIAGGQRVELRLVGEQRFTPAQGNILRAAITDPSLQAVIDPTIMAIVLGVPADEQGALIDRLIGMTFRAPTDVAFDVAPHGPGWKITDLRLGDFSIRAQAATLSRIGDLASKRPPRQRNGPYELGKLVGRAVGILLVVGLVIWFIRRSRKA